METVTVLLKGDKIKSSAALRTGVKLAQMHQSRLYVTYLINDSWSEWLSKITSPFSVRKLMFNITKDVYDVVLKHEGIDLNIVFIRGIRAAKTVVHRFFSDTDMVIVDDSSRQFGPINAFWKSRTERIIRNVQVPVLTVSRLSSRLDIENIAFGSVQSVKLSNVIEKLAGLAAKLRARVDFVAVKLDDDELGEINAQDIHQLAINKGFSGYQIYELESHDLETGMEQFTRDHHPDVIGVVAEQRTRWYHRLWGNASKELIQSTQMPVLEIKPDNAGAIKRRKLQKTMYSVNRQAKAV